MNRFGDDFTSIMINTVVPIINEVRKGGEKAVLDYTEKFDGVRPASLLASTDQLEKGSRETPDEVKAAFSRAIENIREFHSHQVQQTSMYTRKDGTTLGTIYQPIERAAMYVPGGKASYPTSIMMGVIPAQIAGCSEITVITPPGPDGKITPVVGAVCHMLGVDRVVLSGGAQGIAAAAFGTEHIPSSDIIVGPGNIYVTAAKTYLFSLGVIQIDSMAGPSEVLVIADESADPKWVAWDLLSQAEHEEMAKAVLVTTSEKLAQQVIKHIEEDLESGRGRHQIKKTSVSQGLDILLANDLDQAIEFSNQYGPEHMELMVDNPMEHLKSIKNVGSLFLGHYAPVAVGDYYSGTNHILPTGGAARFSSGTSVETFTRRTTFQHLEPGSLRNAQEPVTIMATQEGFEDKHGGSVSIRFDKK